jgi:hypothetical protein
VAQRQPIPERASGESDAAADAGAPQWDSLYKSRAYAEDALIDIVERALRASPAEWLFFRELRVGTGRQNGGAQRLDAFALNTLPHIATKRVCYEVKRRGATFWRK